MKQRYLFRTETINFKRKPIVYYGVLDWRLLLLELKTSRLLVTFLLSTGTKQS